MHVGQWAEVEVGATQTTLIPHSPPRSSTANLIGLLGVPASFALLIGADEILSFLGTPPSTRPLVVRIAIIAIAVAPLLLWALAPRLSAVFGLTWLAEPGPIFMTLDASAFVLRRGEVERAARWEDVARLMIFEGDAMTASADVLLITGERIGLPREFVFPRLASGQRTKLLDEIERHRPQLVNAAEHRERARMISFSIMAVVIGLGIIGLLFVYGPWS